jgi:eukaryotic-like serine/threonine-protein kinase
MYLWIKSASFLIVIYPARASPYGALDMSGNVMEWVADWYGADYYENSPAANPLGPDSGQQRISRGGAWATNDYYVSSTRRFAWDHPFQHRALGFRCVLGHLLKKLNDIQFDPNIKP